MKQAKKVLRQGDADGLCGLYAILHFLRNKAEGWRRSKPEELLWDVLDAARHWRWLDPYHLVNGFQDYQIKFIIDHLIACHGLEFRTIFIRDLPTSDVRIIIEDGLSKNYSALVHLANANHWVAALPIESEIIIFDSAKVDAKKMNGHHKFENGFGVLIIPFSSQKISV